MPPSTLISVDLPAPFSPSSAWISPDLSWKSTFCRALTPGNDLQMFFISSKYSLTAFHHRFFFMSAPRGAPEEQALSSGKPCRRTRRSLPDGRASSRIQNFEKGFALANKAPFLIDCLQLCAGQSRVSAYCQPSVPYSATLSALIMKVSMG